MKEIEGNHFSRPIWIALVDMMQFLEYCIHVDFILFP